MKLARYEQSLEELSNEKQTLQAQFQDEQQQVVQSQMICERLESDIKSQQQVYEQQLETANRVNETLNEQLREIREQMEALQTDYDRRREEILEGGPHLPRKVNPTIAGQSLSGCLERCPGSNYGRICPNPICEYPHRGFVSSEAVKH